MNLEKIFQIISFVVVFCGFFSLWIAGGAGFFASILFIFVIVWAWCVKDTRFQISDKLGTVFMFVTVPLFYLDWKYKLIGIGSSDSAIVGVLAKLILLLTAIKLLQKKSDRDWIFLYLMSFFEVLLAAGISISPLFFASIFLYLLVSLCAIIIFEIRKTSQTVKKSNNRNSREEKNNIIFRLPSTATVLLFMIIVVAAPLFFILPRVGGAGFGGNQGSLSSITGFSDKVRLGEIGKLKQSDQIIMRARVENLRQNNLNSTRWRGIALDKFDGRVWSKSVEQQMIVAKEDGAFRIGYTQSAENIVKQTIFLEPFDSAVLFAMPRPLAVEDGTFQRVFQDYTESPNRDAQIGENSRLNDNNGLYFSRNGMDRITYKVYSDISIPNLEKLRADSVEYPNSFKHFLEKPTQFDDRITAFTAQIIKDKTNRYDKAKAVEQFLQNNFGYTLDLKAGGEDPLADFLFNVKEGHCEYFASAMAMMLRTQGIATRVVNGFQQGEFNETAGVFVIKQKDAHSWVEVYFPETKSWVAFDPTPFAGQTNEANYIGTFGSFKKYLEAFETYWIQYFVAFDNQEQRSLFNSVKSSFQNYQIRTSAWLNQFQGKISDWWQDVRGDKGLQNSVIAIIYAVSYFLGLVLGVLAVYLMFKRISRLSFWHKISFWFKKNNEATIVEFYEKMQKILADKGFLRNPHQTPLEFAFTLNLPEAIKITEKYNRVRFGDKNLSQTEAQEIEDWLKTLEK